MVIPKHFFADSVLYSRKASLWKLTDFGLTSEATANQLNSTTSARGSPGYRAPELGVQNRYSNKVDIWSMGCLLHELATGEKAFISDFEVVTHYVRNVDRGLETSESRSGELIEDERGEL